MWLYIVTLVVVAFILVASYRALGSTVPTEGDVALFVTNVHRWVGEAAQRLAFLDTDEKLTDADVETARDVRKKLSGYQQQLNRLMDTADERDPLSLAIEAMGWACRMIETGGFQVNAGVGDAARGLYDYARRQLSESGVPEVVDRAGDSV
jgi:hypothetical protein